MTGFESVKKFYKDASNPFTFESVDEEKFENFTLQTMETLVVEWFSNKTIDIRVVRQKDASKKISEMEILTIEFYVHDIEKTIKDSLKFGSLDILCENANKRVESIMSSDRIACANHTSAMEKIMKVYNAIKFSDFDFFEFSIGKFLSDEELDAKKMKVA